MSKSDTLQVLVEVDAGPEADASTAADLVVHLRQEILRLDVDDVHFVPQTGKAGAKGGGLDWTKLLVTVASTGGMLSKLIATLQSWLSYDKHRSVTLELAGDKLTIQGVSPEQQKQLVDAWLARHR